MAGSDTFELAGGGSRGSGPPSGRVGNASAIARRGSDELREGTRVQARE